MDNDLAINQIKWNIEDDNFPTKKDLKEMKKLVTRTEKKIERENLKGKTN